MPGKAIRRLIWVPVIHTQADMGGLRESVKAFHVRRAGEAKWKQHIETIEEIWRGIRADIEGLNLPYHRVRLYQDGLPNCGHEASIVKDLAAAGSPNHRLLLDLMAKGAVITGTESADLLLEEYELIREVMAAPTPEKASELARRYKHESGLLLDRRDTYIAGRIAATLRPGETALVFLGLLHSLEGLLPEDIQVTRARHGADGGRPDCKGDSTNG